ncbi:23S rRNA (uracil-5-)-methyltransferase RumA [Dellaglioa algida]|nr:23S rRNA (uracil-5-)-methyltransferase RumA [Dellaglioa algida]
MKKLPPVIKNQEFDTEIIDLTYQGMGVAKVDGYPLFIENALPGEKVSIRVMKVSKNFGFAKVLAFRNESPDRVETKGSAYTQTGIAPLQHLAYPAQLKFKQAQVQELLKKAHLDIEVSDAIGMEDPFHYRNKAQVPVREIAGELKTGFFKKNSHDFIAIEDFLIQDEEIDKAIVAVRDVLQRFHVEAYDERAHKGIIRHIMVRRGHYSKQMMVVLVTRSKKLPMFTEITAAIREALPDVTTIVQNTNSEKTNVILGRENKVLFGPGYIEDQLNGLTFRISPHSFYQINPVQTEKLYAAAFERAGLTGNETVIDAYSGIGTISLSMAKHARQIYGVELVSEAVKDAKENAKINDIDNVRFETGMAENWMENWSHANLRPDVLVVDPPRKGLEPAFIESTLKMQPKKVVYISCNPSTLVRDIEGFMSDGYKVTKPILPVDQFPQTTHIETVTILEK